MIDVVKMMTTVRIDDSDDRWTLVTNVDFNCSPIDDDDSDDWCVINETSQITLYWYYGYYKTLLLVVTGRCDLLVVGDD